MEFARGWDFYGTQISKTLNPAILAGLWCSASSRTLTPVFPLGRQLAAWWWFTLPFPPGHHMKPIQSSGREGKKQYHCGGLSPPPLDFQFLVVVKEQMIKQPITSAALFPVNGGYLWSSFWSMNMFNMWQ